MKNEMVFKSKKKITLVLCSLVLFLAFYFSYIKIIHMVTIQNDKKVKEALLNVTYTEDAALSELEYLKPYTETKYLSVTQRGKLYSTMSVLSYMTENDMVYNHYVACAIFYLQQSKDTHSVVYISNKYIGKLYANGCYSSAEAVLDKISKNNDITLLDPDIKADYYLSCADVAQMQGKNATSDLSKAKEAMQLISNSKNKLLNQAKYDLLCARQDIQRNDFEMAEKRLSNYSEKDNFGFGENQVYVICDFQIPYYEIMAKIELHKNNTKLVDQNVNNYLKLCDDFNFRAMKLHLLHYIVLNTTDFERESTNQYREMEKSASTENLNQMIEEYGHFLLSDIQNTQTELLMSERKKSNENNRIIMVMIVLYILILMYCIISAALNRLNRDGLTHLNSRKQYEKIRLICEKKKIPYCFLMIDIDDFKKVNDTYGHDKGDEVLKKICQILIDYTGRGIFAYRYGGEEMCLFFLKVPEKRAREIAEEIREKISKTIRVDNHFITISGGIGVSKSGENVFQEADRHLYESKNNGKNQIR